MAVVKPFPAIRPQAVKAAQIAALPYDVFTREEAVKEIEKHPLSFLRVDRPETNFPEGTDMYSPQVYEKAGELLWKLVDTGDLCQDMEPCYYIYELSVVRTCADRRSRLRVCGRLSGSCDQVPREYTAGEGGRPYPSY